MMQSRLTPWDETVSVIQQHPSFGSGFGTRINSSRGDVTLGEYSTVLLPPANMETVTWRFWRASACWASSPFLRLY